MKRFIIIRRYGHYVNQMPEEDVSKWIADNVTNPKGKKINVLVRPEDMIEMALNRGYSFELTKQKL